ncbi:hypothetical protein [Edwardsiella ictaluri]|uniref:hypothetical protein n=1 Tax=Edwardsiella ictaluri TaxID=67780 RepID=UPI003784D9D6
METRFNLPTHTVESFISTKQFSDIRKNKQECILQLSDGSYKISWHQNHPHVDNSDNGILTGIKNLFAYFFSGETCAGRLQNTLEIPGKAIFIPNPTIDMLELTCYENQIMMNKGKDMVPLIVNSKADVDKLEVARAQLLEILNKDLKDVDSHENRKKISALQNTKILEKSVLKNIRGDDKLYILGHGHVAGEYIGNERFDVNYLSHLYSCSQQSHTSPACKADIECSLEKDEYSTPEAVAKSLKGFVPRDFSRFYTLTCHSGEARRPISLSDEDLKKAAQPDLEGDGKLAYAHRFFNALHSEGFTQPQVTGYIGAVCITPNDNKHTCEVTLADGSLHDDIPRSDLKHVFSHEVHDVNRK